MTSDRPEHRELLADTHNRASLLVERLRRHEAELLSDHSLTPQGRQNGLAAVGAALAAARRLADLAAPNAAGLGTSSPDSSPAPEGQSQ